MPELTASVQVSAEALLPWLQAAIGVVALASIFYAAQQSRLQRQAILDEAHRRESERQERAFLTTSTMYTDWLDRCLAHPGLPISRWALTAPEPGPPPAASPHPPTTSAEGSRTDSGEPDRLAEGLLYERLFLMLEAAYVMYNSPVGGISHTSDGDFRARQWGGWWRWVQDLASETTIDLSGWWYRLGNSDTYDIEFSRLMREELARGRRRQLAAQMVSRDLSADDLERLGELVGLTFRDHDGPSEDLLGRVLALQGKDEVGVLTMRMPGSARMVAAAVVEWFPRDGSAFLWSLAVDPAHQGGGLGGILFEAVADTAAARGCPRLFLQVDAPRHTLRDGCEDCRRIAFYEDHGCELLPMTEHASEPTGEATPAYWYMLRQRTGESPDVAQLRRLLELSMRDSQLGEPSSSGTPELPAASLASIGDTPQPRA